MSYDDIPEVFRRALEEAERRAGRNNDEDIIDGDVEEPSPPGGPPTAPRQRPTADGPSPLQSRRVWVLLGLFILFLSFRWIVTTYTDWLWFQNVGYESVWLKRLTTQLAAFAIFFVVAAVITFINLRVASRGALATSDSFSFQPLRFPGFNWLIGGVTAFLSFLFATTAGASWETFLQYFYRVDWSLSEPVFGQSISFYLFELPVFRFLQGWFVPLLFFNLVGVVALYAAHNIEAIRTGSWRPQSLDPLRRHVAVLAGLIALLVAAGYLLNRFELVYSTRGLVFGAGATDLTISAPLLLVNAVLMLLLALALFYNAFNFNLRPVIAAAAVWFVTVVIIGGFLPGLYQRYRIEPNELQLETPYINTNIEFTRKAFGLDEIRVESFGSVDPLTAQDLDDNAAALDNIRLWDYRVLPENYEQLQALRPYYQFGDIDIDRYTINGEVRQVMLSGRELDYSDVSDSWVNRKLVFTHGYGVVMNPVDRFTRNGQPEFIISDLPPVSDVDITIDRPEIYFGEKMSETVYVNSARPEFDYPSADDTDTGIENVTTHYEGVGGVEMSGTLRRLSMAIRFGDINLLLSDDITPETRVLLYRQIEQRILEISPFLSLDFDPYLVLADGRMVWMVDAYTASDNFPYSEPSPVGSGGIPRGSNYVRNVAKITVDAYDGTVNYYLLDTDDPIVATYANAFPDLFQPFDAMPEALKAHVRYPESMFLIQSNQYLKYHMESTSVFYNQEDLWSIPLETFAEGQPQQIEPYYVVFSLPGETETEYLLIQPYTPFGRNNMVAWIAARNDPANYGELVVYELPKQELVFGPIQVEGRIDQEPAISEQLSLWDQRGSSVIRGNLLVIPLNNSFLYVEPLYLKSETSAFPELSRVIVASGENVVMRESLGEALSALLGATVATGADTDSGDSADSGTTPDLDIPIDATIESIIDSANANFAAAEQAQRDGDWAAYGAALEALEDDLQRLGQLSAETE